ncbi:type VII secretion-associated serine protease mycosin [Mycobacterium sp. OTB74]|uniref:type VII secretion-associated serine protease mycosin n=1 Tax=Mycobacterium sp. OTB74 TaxID=1853452 RepID=UPI0024768E27|nr:type VII secretion-associated serine protease mycosin [Mycobacterium sp. OTB74]
MRRGISLLATVLTVSASAVPTAGAVAPPHVDEHAAPPSGGTGPVAPMGQRGPCVTAGVLPGSSPGAGPGQAMLNLTDARTYSKGEGQTVAVIDTGVHPGPRLPNVHAGGDFVENTDGLTDCDGHGTLVAGLIGGQPGPDGFSGVAPAARIIAIRQTSERYSPRGSGDDPAASRAAIEVASLARAVVRAADQGARVIAVTAVACLPADRPIDQSELGAALKYAAQEKDAVIIAAAGNVQAGLAGGPACQANPLDNPGQRTDPRNWAGVKSVSIPSWWQPYVLSVGSLDPAGQPSEFTMPGPWVGIAAPGEGITSIGNAAGGLANALPNERGDLFALRSSSYAAAYVAGVAALVRSRFPALNATEVKHRLTATAHGAARSPSNLVGVGIVDPVAALTWNLPAAGAPPKAVVVAPPPEPAQPDTTPRTIAFTGVAGLAVVALLALVAYRRKDGAR